MLTKVISGGQVGVDIAALRAAQKAGIETGGTMPRGFITKHGPKPKWAEQFHLTEHASSLYPPRTYQNVLDADATLRLAKDFESAGELCTLKAIGLYDKPYLDIDLLRIPPHEKVVEWLQQTNISVLNVAGNAGQFDPETKGIEEVVEAYLYEIFFLLALRESVKRME